MKTNQITWDKANAGEMPSTLGAKACLNPNGVQGIWKAPLASKKEQSRDEGYVLFLALL
jgi:hypothetical protein